MKTAKSALLDEIFDAEKLVYDDCPRWQMQCPACHEAVFKVLRNDDGKELHYFSHYRKDKLLNEECELRVGAMKRDEVEKHNAAARGQTLAYYLSVLREQIIKRVGGAAPEPRACERIFVDDLAKELSKVPNAHEWFLDPLDIGDAVLSFSIERTASIVSNISRHLVSRTGRNNLNLLLLAAIRIAPALIRAYARKEEARGFYVEEDIEQASNIERLSALKKRRESWDFYEGLSDQELRHLRLEVLYYAGKILLEIDYLELLRDFRVRQSAGASA